MSYLACSARKKIEITENKSYIKIFLLLFFIQEVSSTCGPMNRTRRKKITSVRDEENNEC